MVQFDHEPDSIRYVPLPDGKADVWLRKDITEVNSDEGTFWTAEEVYIRTQLSREEVETQAEELFFMKSDLQNTLTDIVQRHMDETVRLRNYDNIVSACSYAYSTDETFQREARACIAWRDAVWRYCYQVLAEVQNNARPIPSASELLAELPRLEW